MEETVGYRRLQQFAASGDSTSLIPLGVGTFNRHFALLIFYSLLSGHAITSASFNAFSASALTS